MRSYSGAIKKKLTGLSAEHHVITKTFKTMRPILVGLAFVFNKQHTIVICQKYKRYILCLVNDFLLLQSFQWIDFDVS
jgi:hypothetical protein